ncbi:MAG TPA: V-type ATP synthase subunit D [Candidatus Methanomethylophilaceae archaeon]|nr:V-type ATP synthase subunit D [Candidatus Methanomethylophilaceae archaeon]
MPSQEITPTRSVLLEVKKRIKLSESGYKILKMKRDGLIIEFFEIMEQAREMRDRVVKDYEDAITKIDIALAVDGALAVKSAAYALKSDPQVKIRNKSIMGLIVPKIEAEAVHTPLVERGYGVISTSMYIEDAARAFEKLLETMVEAAEVETTMKKLLDEIEKTKRRVNALEFKVIPEMKEAEAFIEFRLDEMEREEITRLKHLKKKAEAGAEG